MGIDAGPIIASEGLVFQLDAGNYKNYPGLGNTAYETNLSVTGNMQGGVAFTTNNSGYFSFDGSNDTIQFPRISALDFQYNTAFSINIFTRMRAANSGWGYVVTTRGVDANGIAYSGWGLGRQGNSLIGIVGGYTGNTWSLNYSSQATFLNEVYDKWALVSYVNTGVVGEQKIYVNGQNRISSISSTYAYVVNYGSNNNLSFARSNADGPGHYINCDLAHTSIYNRALSQQEILQNYIALKRRFGL